MAKIILNVTTDVKQAKNDIDKLKSSVQNLAKSFSNIKADKDLTAQIKALTEYNKSLAAATEKVAKVNNQNAIANEKLAQAQAKTAKEAAKVAEAEAKATTAKIKSADATGKLHITEEKLEQQQNKTAKSALELEKAQQKSAKTAEESEKKHKGLVETLMQWSIVAKVVQSGVRLVKSAFDDMNKTLADTERRIIAIQRVLPEGSVADTDLANRLYDLAIEYGQSFANVSDIATNFARTGLSYADTIEATRAALLALNVAELDSTQATEGMIAIMAQFSLSAEEMETVVDKLNKTADRFPVTTEKLLTALQRMGSAASNAGLTLNESIGLVTALSEATGRGGSNIGTALNSLIQYSKKDKALGIYASLSSDMAAIVNQYKIGAANILDVWRGLSVEINKLSGQQSEKLDELANYFSSGEGAGLKDELESELGDIFNDVNSIYSTANAHRQNYFIALLNNMDTVAAATEEARNAEGYSIKENEKEMQTYEKRVTALQEHWHKLANDEQGWLAFRKGLVEIGDTLLTVIEWTGGLRTAFTALGTVVGLVFGQKIITQIKGFITSLRAAKTETVSFATALNEVYGILGAVLTVVSIITGAVEQYKQNQHQANLETIQAWETQKKDAEELQKLYEKYKSLETTSSDYEDVEKQIVSLLGSKASLLDGLTAGTDKYRESIEKLTESEIENAKASAARAATAALDEFIASDQTNLGNAAENIFAAYRNNAWQTDKHYNNGENHINYILQKLGINLTNDWESNTTKLADIKNSKDLASQINDYIAYHDALQKLEEFARGADVGLKGYIYGSTAYSEIRKGAESGTALETALQKAIESYLFGKSPSTAAEANILKAETDKYLANLFSYDFSGNENLQNKIDAWISQYLFTEGSSSSGASARSGALTLADIKSKYSDIADEFDALAAKGTEQNKILDKQNDIADKKKELTQKQNDLLEAQKKLEETIAEEKAKYVSDVLSKYVDSLETQNTLFEKQNDILEAQQKLTEAIEKARQEYIKATLTEYLDGLNTNNEITERQQKIDEARAKVDEARLKVEEARLKVEEKRKAVKEAEYNLQKAQDDLEYARNNRTERVYNKTTGMWEYQANQKTVQTAQDRLRQATEAVENATKDVEDAVNSVETAVKNVETAENNVESAVDNLTKYLQDQAIEEITSAITDGRISESEVDAIFSKWFGQGGAGEWGEGVKNTIVNAIKKADSEARKDATVVSAMQSVTKAQSALTKFLQNKTVTEITEMFKSGRLDSGAVDEVIAKWFGSDGAGEWGDGIKSAISSAIISADEKIAENENVRKAQENVQKAQSAVNTAQTNINKAENSLKDYITQSFYSDFATLFRGESVSQSDLDALIARYRALGISEKDISEANNVLAKYLKYRPIYQGNKNERDFAEYSANSEYYDQDKLAVKVGTMIVDSDKTTVNAVNASASHTGQVDFYGDESKGLRGYDSGGVLYGMGGIKATNQPELVIDPALTRRILDPASNEAFSKFANALGVIFGNPMRDFGARSAYSNNWQNASTNDNRSYMINGVPIPKEAAENFTIAQLFENMDLV